MDRRGNVDERQSKKREVMEESVNGQPTVISSDAATSTYSMKMVLYRADRLCVLPVVSHALSVLIRGKLAHVTCFSSLSIDCYASGKKIWYLVT